MHDRAFGVYASHSDYSKTRSRLAPFAFGKLNSAVGPLGPISPTSTSAILALLS